MSQDQTEDLLPSSALQNPAQPPLVLVDHKPNLVTVQYYDWAARKLVNAVPEDFSTVQGVLASLGQQLRRVANYGIAIGSGTFSGNPTQLAAQGFLHMPGGGPTAGPGGGPGPTGIFSAVAGQPGLYNVSAAAYQLAEVISDLRYLVIASGPVTLSQPTTEVGTYVAYSDVAGKNVLQPGQQSSVLLIKPVEDTMDGTLGGSGNLSTSGVRVMLQPSAGTSGSPSVRVRVLGNLHSQQNSMSVPSVPVDVSLTG